MVFVVSFVYLFMNSWGLNIMKITKIWTNNHKNMKIPLHRNTVGLLQNYLVLFIKQGNKLWKQQQKNRITLRKMGLGENTQILKYKRLHFQNSSPALIPENEHQIHWMLSAVKNLTTSLKILTGSWTVFVIWSHLGHMAYQILWKELDLITAIPELIKHSW